MEESSVRERPFRSAHAPSGDIFGLIFPYVFSHPPASLGRAVSCTMLRVNTTSCAVGHCSQLAPGTVKGSGLRQRAILKLKGGKKEQSILDMGEKNIWKAFHLTRLFCDI